jgi:hypothetical protein
MRVLLCLIILPLPQIKICFMRALFTVFLMISAGLLFGQINESDYIILNSQDTILGNVTNSINKYGQCKLVTKQSSKTYTPEDIIGYSSNSNYFTSNITDSTFVQVLVAGKLNIYKHFDQYIAQKGNETYILKKETKQVVVDGKIVTKEVDKWKGILSFLIGDCLNAQSISHVKFIDHDLTKVTVKYNQCSGAEYKEYGEELPWTKFQVGLSANYMISKMTTVDPLGYYPETFRSYESNDIGVGINSLITFPRIMERFGFRLDAIFSKSQFEGEKEINFNLFRDDLIRTRFELQTLNVPLAAHYTFFKVNNTHIFAEAGFQYIFHMSSKSVSSRDEMYTNGDVTIVPEFELIALDNKQSGYNVGIGFIHYFKKFGAIGTIRYTTNSDFTNIAEFSAKINTIGFHIGIITN